MGRIYLVHTNGGGAILRMEGEQQEKSYSLLFIDLCVYTGEMPLRV